MTNQPKPLSASPELRAIASTYLSEGAEVGYMLAVDRIRLLERQLAEVQARLNESCPICGKPESEHGSVCPNEKDDRRIAAMREALEKIAKGEGRFSRDQLTHASNTIEDMKAIAEEALGRKAAGEKP
jgi:hypothetical protein